MDIPFRFPVFPLPPLRAAGCLLLSLLPLACGGRALELGDDDGGTSWPSLASTGPVNDAGVLLTAVDGGDGFAPVSDTIPPACSEPMGDELPVNSADELQSLVAGRWIFCAGPQTWQLATSANPNVAGLEFTNQPAPAAGQGYVQYFLYADAANELVRGTGVANQAAVSWSDSDEKDAAGGEIFSMDEAADDSFGGPFITLTHSPTGMLLNSPNSQLYLVPVP